MALWETVLAGGAYLAPQLLAQDQAKRANDDANKANRENARDNAIMQKEFAQNGIRWKVEDAKQAGLHPLAALGATTQSFSPVSIGAQPDPSHQYTSQMGQDITRAIQSTRTDQERKLAELQLANAQADLDGKTIDNQIRASQFRKMQQTGPALPSTAFSPTGVPGQGDATRITPSESTSSHPGRPAMQAGAINDYGFTRTERGFAVVPSKDVKERIEDNLLMESAHAYRNLILPNFGAGPQPPPKEWLPPGYTSWKFDPMYQEFRPYGGDHKKLTPKYRKRDFNPF